MTRLLKPALLGTAAVIVASVSPVPGALPPAVERLLDPSATLGQACGGRASDGASPRPWVIAAAAYARTAAPAAADAPALMEGLGTVHYKVTTSNPEAQHYFDQGLALTYGFNHAAAIRYFRRAQALDPTCAMCFWGEGYAHGPNINAPMDPDVNARAVAVALEARRLGAKATPAEQALIGAMSSRYSADPAAGRAKLDRGYAQAMLDVASRFPGDDTVAVLAAEAVMDTRPWDYWEADGRTPKENIGRAVELVEGVLGRTPDHPQAAHLYIHLVEASTTPGRAEAAADRLAAPLMPAAGHMVHMPAHIYYRLGRWKDSIAANVAAARADERFLAGAPDDRFYRFAYYPHNVHFLLTSAQMAGDMPTVIAEARKLGRVVNADVTSAFPWVQPVDAAPYLAYAQFASPAETLALPAPDPRLPYVTAMWHYARAVAYAGLGDEPSFEREVEAIRRIRTTTDLKGMTDQLVPAPDLLRLAETVAAGRLAYARGDYAGAVAQYRQAATIEEGIRYMEPPFWYYPVHQSLGAALYAMKDYPAARAAFQEALVDSPNNGWALWGLARTQNALGDRAGEQATLAAFRRAWLGDPAWLHMNRL
jgi:tetratricopeptide (TPR) repeat protein